MSYDKNATPKYYCSVNIAASFVAASISSAKRQASNAMNRSVYPVDVMQVYDYESGIQSMTLRRINRKAPDGTIKYGKWN